MILGVAEKDRFFLENNSPLIIFKGELIDFTVPKNEFNSLRSLNEYLVKFNLIPSNWQEIKTNYYAQKTPDWNRFNHLILNDIYFNKLYRKSSIDFPLALANIGNSLIQLSENKSNNFKDIYQIIFINANKDKVLQWVIFAENCFLPFSFQQIIINPFD